MGQGNDSEQPADQVQDTDLHEIIGHLMRCQLQLICKHQSPISTSFGQFVQQSNNSVGMHLAFPFHKVIEAGGSGGRGQSIHSSASKKKKVKKML